MIPLVVDTWDNEEIDAIQSVIKSNRFTMGPRVEEFEKEFALVHNSKYAVCVNSGSSANLIALSAAFFTQGFKRGDEVIVPTIGWSTTYSPLFYLGLNPNFVDVSIDTLNIDLDLVNDAISEKTKAILVVNLLGRPAALRKLKRLCDDKNLVLIEDNCEAMGAKIGEQLTGTFGLAGTFSFFFSHHITTIEGGMITTNCNKFRDACMSLRAHGWTRELTEDSYLNDKSVSDFKKLFWFQLPGFNVRPTEFTGAVGLVQLKKFPNMLSNRIENYKKLEALVSNFNDIKLFPYEDGHSAFSFAFKCKNRMVRDHVLEVFSDNGIATRPVASGNILDQPMLSFFESYNTNCPNEISKLTDELCFMIGNHGHDMGESLQYLEKSLKKALE